MKKNLYVLGATTIISDSVGAIRENIKVSEQTNYDIDGISAELGGMISEDQRWTN